MSAARAPFGYSLCRFWLRLSCASALWTLASGVARADDWLALLPACAMPEPPSAPLALHYPRPGLPAVVAAGSSLVARVRVPVGLTPPPGVQQERALRGFSARLRGRAIGLGAARGELRYDLDVVNLRPDAGSSLVYRVSLAVPAYVAPGTYTLALSTPFGKRQAEYAVRVVASGSSPRLARAAEAKSRTLRDLATAPVDVWFAGGTEHVIFPPVLPAEEEPHVAQPLLDVTGISVALRVSGHLLVASGCASPQPVFEAEVARLLAAERIVRVPLDASSRRAGAPFAPLASGAGASFTLDVADGGVLEARNDTPSERELLVSFPLGRALVSEGAERELHPALDLGQPAVEALVARVRLRPHTRARVRLGDAAPMPPLLALSPSRVTAGTRRRIEVKGAPPGVRVAFDLGHGRSALSGSSLSVSFAEPGAVPVHALVIAPEGGATALHDELWVEAYRPPSCATSRPRASVASLPAFALALLWCAARLLKRRRTARFGNRLERR